MIEEALRTHLMSQDELVECLAKYADEPAIFNQTAPADTDEGWERNTQYNRIVFAEDLQGDPERTMGGMLVVDIFCNEDDENEYFPEDIEPIVRHLIDGYFFSNGTFVVSAQWKNSSPFTEDTDKVSGCTVAFELLAFPVLSTINPDVIERLNEWTSELKSLDIHVINYEELPKEVWKPVGEETAVYWRVVTDSDANWIPNTFQTIWRTATIRGHIFAEDMRTAAHVSRGLITRLYADKRLLRDGETPIMVNRRNTSDDGADPLRTGQVTVEATYGVIVHFEPDEFLSDINY